MPWSLAAHQQETATESMQSTRT